MDYLGAHMSISGGLSKAIGRGSAAGCGVIQIFTQNSNQWRGKAVSDSEVALFREKRAAAGLYDIVSHDIYLINLAAAPGEVRDKSLAGFLEEMERCTRLGIDKIVMHPGSHVGEGEETGISRIVEAFDYLLETGKDFSGKILLETTAGQGTNIGYRFEQLGEIRNRSAHPDRFGYCFDTCHTFAAGYDFTSEEGYQKVFADFDRILGLENLLAFHFNDSKKGLGSRVDRHDHIGQGVLGLSGFRLLMNDERFVRVPKILETPKGDNEEMDAINLKTLRDLVE
ncbi:MAG: deoxyribonuclease IV [Deltaproteobacteria bacterium]|nr:deoxyribonuclease IV [Deltaproteobacteria bacterium]MRR54659.1 deoxyribonuclease IV [Deltaproteobacteria bacterium]TLN02452.1 MAG: deoxyribonuclease IV [bacterium]